MEIDNEHSLFDQDFYFDDELYERHLNGTFPAVHLNSASMSAPFPSVRRASNQIAMREKHLSDQEKMFILKDARTKAAALVNLPPSSESGVVFDVTPPKLQVSHSG